jgi:hypothetical protein
MCDWMFNTVIKSLLVLLVTVLQIELENSFNFWFWGVYFLIMSETKKMKTFAIQKKKKWTF